MLIQNFNTFQRMTQFFRTRVPQTILDDLYPLRDDDEAVKAYGVRLCRDMCNTLTAAGIRGFHFFTLNLEKSVMAVLKSIGVEESAVVRRCVRMHILYADTPSFIPISHSSLIIHPYHT